jgi:hypothetical protein
LVARGIARVRALAAGALKAILDNIWVVVLENVMANWEYLKNSFKLV